MLNDYVKTQLCLNTTKSRKQQYNNIIKTKYRQNKSDAV